ncbi:serum response factor-like [Carcharodon carcharias]|uniref:serum response factor-like n=1 Tax=Carcharodon carcharias TaxID=13397 RepID=UPI001B7EDC9B|nr:serum response factor-like [Carcharodon carcharias]
MLQSPAGAAAAPPESSSSSSPPAGSLQPAAPQPPPAPPPGAALLLARDRESHLSTPYSGSEPSTDDEEEMVVTPAPVDRRGAKRRLSELEAAAAAGLAGVSGHEAGLEGGGGGLAAAVGGYGAAAAGAGAGAGSAAGAGLKPGKKTRGRVKIKMEFIDNKLRRYTTFSKRKTGIMKKAYELSTLTGTQVLLLVASETGHVYTFATRKLQPMITSETGKALIQTCLNSPDSPPRSDPTTDQRMSATGFEETDLTYQVSETDSSGENKVFSSLRGAFCGRCPMPELLIVLNRLLPISSIPCGYGKHLFFHIVSGKKLPATGTALPGTPTIPIGQLQQHSLAIQGQQGQVVTSQSQQGQQTVFRFPASAGGQIVSIAGECRCLDSVKADDLSCCSPDAQYSN